jgi:hypothetical protein
MDKDPECNANQLMNAVRQNYTLVKVVLMRGTSMFSEDEAIRTLAAC